MVQEVMRRYGIQQADVEKWFGSCFVCLFSVFRYDGVDIRAERFISEAALDTALTTLSVSGVSVTAPQDHSPGVIDQHNKTTPVGLIDSNFASLRRDIKSMKLYSRPELVWLCCVCQLTWTVSVVPQTH